MLTEEKQDCDFEWSDLGDPATGRPNLGNMAPVLVYRLMQFTIRDVLSASYGVDMANKTLYNAGRLAGQRLCENMLDVDLGITDFVVQLQKTLRELRIGILHVEKANLASMEMTMSIEEDLDCSGLPPSGEVICVYDEGFIAGILYAYTGKEFQVREIDCWGTGDRTCRFDVRLEEPIYHASS